MVAVQWQAVEATTRYLQRIIRRDLCLAQNVETNDCRNEKVF